MENIDKILADLMTEIRAISLTQTLSDAERMKQIEKFLERLLENAD